MTDPREAKLPKWAQDALKNERWRADEAERRLAAHVETVEPTTIWYGDWENKVYIPHPDFARVVFMMRPGGDGSFDEITVGFRYGKLHINAGRAIAVEPIGANCLDVVLRDI
jgi:hypothetical protein